MIFVTIFVIQKYDSMKSKQTFKNKETALTKRVKELLDFSPPKDLRRSIQHVFFNYLNEKNKIFPTNFHNVATDVYLLLSFLEDAEDILENKEITRTQVKLLRLSDRKTGKLIPHTEVNRNDLKWLKKTGK